MSTKFIRAGMISMDFAMAASFGRRDSGTATSPTFGSIVQKVAIARWSRTLGTLAAAGVPLLQAIEITGRTSGNAVIEDAMDEVSASIRRGGTLAAPLREAPVFPPMVSHMVGVGEETGDLDQMLSKVADFYEDEVDAAVKALMSILEPILIVVIGAAVGFIVQVRRGWSFSANARPFAAMPEASGVPDKPRGLTA